MHETIGADVPGSELAARHPRDVSGGERQRSALEIILNAHAEVLLLDEPTRGMDPRRRDALADAPRRERAGVTVVATHDAEFAAAFATRVILLGDGRPGRRRHAAPRCSPAAGTSPPRSRASSAARAGR